MELLEDGGHVATDVGVSEKVGGRALDVLKRNNLIKTQ